MEVVPETAQMDNLVVGCTWPKDLERVVHRVEVDMKGSYLVVAEVDYMEEVV